MSTIVINWNIVAIIVLVIVFLRYCAPLFLLTAAFGAGRKDMASIMSVIIILFVLIIFFACLEWGYAWLIPIAKVIGVGIVLYLSFLLIRKLLMSIGK